MDAAQLQRVILIARYAASAVACEQQHKVAWPSHTARPGGAQDSPLRLGAAPRQRKLSAAAGRDVVGAVDGAGRPADGLRRPSSGARSASRLQPTNGPAGAASVEALVQLDDEAAAAGGERSELDDNDLPSDGSKLHSNGRHTDFSVGNAPRWFANSGKTHTYEVSTTLQRCTRI